MAQQFGKTWWGQQWLQSLNNIDYSNRLPRGGSYARKGAVEKINVSENQIHAKVAGSRPEPYDVTIILPPFFDPELSRFMEALIARPVIISRLLNRELDPEVLPIAEQAGLKVFPTQWTDFKMQCSCPDWAVPCKHLAAVIYKVCAEIDNNPFLVFNLHRVDLIEELNKRGLFVSTENTVIPELKALCIKKPALKTKEPTYDPENAYGKLSYAALSPVHEPLIALLAGFPVFYPGTADFKDKYSQSIHRVVRNAQRILKGKISPDSLSGSPDVGRLPQIGVHSVLQVAADKTCTAQIKVDKKRLSFPQFAAQMIAVPASKIYDYQPAAAALHSAFFLSLHLAANGSIVPQITALPDGRYLVRWLPAMLSKDVRQLVHKMKALLPPGIFTWQEGAQTTPVNVDTALNLLSVFITEWVSMLSAKIPRDRFLDLFFRKAPDAFRNPGEEEVAGGIQAWLQKYYIAQGRYKPQIVVEETPGEQFLINLHITNSNGALEQPVPLREVLTQRKFDKARFEILRSLAQLSGFITGLDACINSKGEENILMDNEAFTPFLMQMVPAVQLLDIDILLPKSLQQILKPKPSVKLKKKKGRSFLHLDQLLDFDWQIAVGDTLLDEKAFKRLLKRSDGLIKYKSRYIYVSKEELERLHKHFSGEKNLSAFQMLRSALSGDYFGAKVSFTPEVAAMIKEISETNEIAVPRALRASLRPYQQRGYSWMYRNARVGFGSVIADDMGLGKTLQVITTLLKYKEEGLLQDKKVLVIAPTGLLTNWQAEIERFAPSLKTQLFHGANRRLEKGFDVLLTSYGIVRSDKTHLKKLAWHSVVIDEAQNIKNQDTAQAKAVKSLRADNFIAMSGTPVENRLSEFWSIMDFSNRGLLGSDKEFRETYGIPIETYNDEAVAEKMKKVTAPFMMRRLKTDKTIISDLPEKMEMDCFATLVKEQASLYETTLTEAMKEIEAIDATDKKGLFVRQGLVLQMILALKQICNHPAQFLKNKTRDASLSGKLNLLFDKLDSIMESGEKVLIFTQFREMGSLLQHFIATRYETTPLFYHGGCSVKQRRAMTEAFQSNHADKIFILSLKAAGTGLNLTAASHVIHYDLWWNPAVEAQATDRAYRIGQRNNVMVHRFITKNTFEERINDMIQSKKALANMTIATGENWIGNLSNKELKALFTING